MPTLNPSPRRARLAPVHLAAALGSALLLSACASDPSRAYTPEHETSISDAQNQYQNIRGREALRAPSQIQLTLPERGQARKAGEQPEAVAATSAPAVDPNMLPPDVLDAQGATAAVAAPLQDGSPWVRDTQTYMGTVPCYTGNTAACRAQRVTLTLSPNGRWRSRTVTVEPAQADAQPYTDEGCWRASGDQRERITLYDAKRTSSVASFSFSQGNALILRTLHDQPSTLTYRLSRQPDLDPINEHGDTQLNCQLAP